MSCKRNAFMMLIQADQERALNYLSSCIDQVQSFGDILQLVIVELIYKVNNWEAPSETDSQSNRWWVGVNNFSSPPGETECQSTP